MKLEALAMVSAQREIKYTMQFIIDSTRGQSCFFLFQFLIAPFNGNLVYEENLPSFLIQSEYVDKNGQILLSSLIFIYIKKLPFI